MLTWARATRLGLVVLALALAAPLASAQSQASLAAGLEAQYRAAIVRERRLADERELGLIAAAETRMRSARAALASAQSDRAAAERELETARAEYVRLVNAVELHDATARIQVEAFRAELEGRLPEATPEMVAAYQEFADGDRTRAFQTLEVLINARIAAVRTAARLAAAADVRQLARFRAIMNANGEASLADVRALWQQAAELDPENFTTHLALANLHGRRGGDAQRARTEAERTLALASTPLQRYQATLTLGDILEDLGNRARARELYDGSLVLAREIVAAEPNSPWLERYVLVSHSSIGGLQESSGELGGALASYRETLSIGQRLLASRPSNQGWRRDVALSHGLIGDIQATQGDIAGARASFDQSLELFRALALELPNRRPAQGDLIMGLNRLARLAMIRSDFQAARDRSDEAAAIARGLAESDSSDVQAQRQYFLALERAAQASVRMRDLAGAQTRYEQCLAIARVLAADATNIRRQRDVALALSGLGDVMFERGDRAGATPYYVESLEIRRRLAATDASSAELQRDLLVGLDRARHVGVGGIRWADLVVQMEAMERAGMLNPSDRNYLARARLGAATERP